MNRLTKSQWQAVNARNTDILVAASAGTGKTHAIISRVVGLIMGRAAEEYDKEGIEDRSKRVPVTKILLMTFTNAAAAEMKLRLSEALVKELNTSDDLERRQYITEQIDAIPLSNISTIHSYCADIIRDFFQEAEVNPLFQIADNQDNNAYVADAIVKTLEKLNLDERLIRLREIFSIKLQDLKLQDVIVGIYKYAEGQENMAAWLDEIAVSQYQGAYEKTVAFNYYVAAINSSALEMLEMVQYNIDYVKTQGLKNCLDWLNSLYYRYTLLAKAKNLDDIIAGSEIIYSESPPRASKGYTPIKKALTEAIKEFNQAFLLDSVKDKDKIIRQIGNIAQIAKDMIFVVKEFANQYIRLKEKDNKLTFADLEHYAIKLLNNEKIREDISLRYDYILIDEYQDINYLQEFIITSLSRSGNLFMVGDSKQSIYRFRHAVPEIFLKKLRGYISSGSGMVADFNHNFRSRPAILNYVNSVFSKVMSKEFGGIDYGREAMLIPEVDDEDKYLLANDFPAVSIITYKMPKSIKKYISEEIYSVERHNIEEAGITSAIKEADIIVSAVRELVNKSYYDRKAGGIKNLSYSDIAILFRKRNPQNREIISCLIEKGIPLDVSTFISEDKSDEVRLLVNMLRVIDNYHDEIPLIAVMRSFIGKFSDNELGEIRLIDNNKKTPFYELLLRIDKSEIKTKAEALINLIDKYRAKSGYMGVYDLLREIIDDTGYDRYILAHADGEIMYKGLMCFINSLRDKSYAVSISRFLFHYDNYIEEIEGGSAECGLNAITVSTMHSAKGLEYPVVIIANADNAFKSSHGDYIMDKELGLSFKDYNIESREKADNLLYSIMAYRKQMREREDNLNLFYVALTRAKNYLVIIGKEGADGLMQRKADAKNYLDWASQGLDKAVYCPEADASDEDRSEKEPDIEHRIAYFSPKYDELYYDKIKEVLTFRYPYKESASTGIKYTVTAINKGEDQAGIYVPPLFQEDSAFLGTAYHKAMEHIDLKCNSIAEVEEDMRRMLSLNLITEDEAIELDARHLLSILSSDIMRYARDNETLREKSFMLKVKADEIMDIGVRDEVLLQGTIDLIIMGKENIIVDYKRSERQDTKYFIDTYKKQLKLYQLAAERILNIKIHRKVIYLINQLKEIDID